MCHFVLGANLRVYFRKVPAAKTNAARFAGAAFCIATHPRVASMNLAGILLGIINIAIVIAILLLVGAIILWFMGWMGIAVPANVQKGFIAVVALIGLYMIVALLLGMPTWRIIGGFHGHTISSAVATSAPA